MLEAKPRLSVISEEDTSPVRLPSTLEDDEDGPRDVRAAAVSADGVADTPRDLVWRSASPFTVCSADADKWLNDQEGAPAVTAD